MASLAVGKTEDTSTLSGIPDGQKMLDLKLEPANALALENLRTEWITLAQDAAEPNPFYHHWNLAPALASIAAEVDVQLMTVRSHDQLIGLLPIRHTNSYYGRLIPHVRGWLHDNAFCGVPLVRTGDELDFWNCVLEYLNAAPSADILLHLAQLPSEGQVTDALFTALAQQRHPASIVQRAERAMLASDLDAQSYFEAAMSNKKRKELRRQAKRLGELGAITFERHNNADNLDQWTESFLALEHAGWKGREGSSLSSDAANSAYFREALQAGAEAEHIERLSLMLDDKPIAMLVTFLTSPGSFSFKTAFDEDYARFSPGVLLQRENLALLERGDTQWCDSCAAADHPMIERIWREKKEMISVNIAIGGRMRRSAFKLMRMAERNAENMEFRADG